MSEGIYFKHFVMVIVVYVGAIFPLTLVFKIFDSAEETNKKFGVALQIIQHFCIYLFMYMFDSSIPFVHANAGIAILSVLLLFTLTACKLII